MTENTADIVLPAPDAPATDWNAALLRANSAYRKARRAHANAVADKLILARRQKTLKREIIKGLRAGGMAITPANKEYVDDPRWEVALDEIEKADIDIVDLDCNRAIATHDRETVHAAFERATMERQITAPLVVQTDGSMFQMGASVKPADVITIVEDYLRRQGTSHANRG